MRLLVCTTIMIFFLVYGCGGPDVADGFGAETTNGTISVNLGIPNVKEVQYEVTLIPISFNPTKDGIADIRRDTTDKEGVLEITAVTPDDYNITARAISDLYKQQLFLNVNVDELDTVKLIDTLKPTGTLKVRFDNKEDVDGFTVFFLGTEISKLISSGIVFEDPYYVITLDSLPAGKFPQLFIWEGEPLAPYVATDSIEIFSDSTVVVNSPL